MPRRTLINGMVSTELKLLNKPPVEQLSVIIFPGIMRTCEYFSGFER